MEDAERRELEKALVDLDKKVDRHGALLADMKREIHILFGKVDAIGHSLNGNGTPGLKSQTERNATRLEGIEMRFATIDRIVVSIGTALIVSGILGGIALAWKVGGP